MLQYIIILCLFLFHINITQHQFNFMEISEQGLTITSKLDKLKFSRWHMVVAVALGFVWIFDGYEVSLISVMSQYIKQQFDQSKYKLLASSYQLGCIIGSILFGICAYILGRRKIFMITLILYAIGIILSMIPSSFVFFLLGRFITGISVGGQFTAIFTAIDEFLPPSVRGRVDIAIDGTWHMGGACAAILNLCLGYTSQWRLLFGVGLAGVSAIYLLRRNVPQSPRWLILAGRITQANNTVSRIIETVNHKNFFLQKYSQNAQQLQNQLNQSQKSQVIQQDKNQDQQLNPSTATNFKAYTNQICQIIFKIFCRHTKRLLLSFLLIFSQAFLFNSVYYQYPSTLTDKYDFDQQKISLYMLPLSLVSFFSTLAVGTFFDTIGRKIMILVTYTMSGILLLLIEFLIDGPIMLEIFVCCMFFFTSPAASSANLIASQIFPTYARTLALCIIFIMSMFGGMCGVWVNEYLVGALLMILSGIAGYIWCPKAQKKSLQQIANMQ